MFRYKDLTLIAFVILFCESSSKSAPDYIKPCPGLKSECLKKNIQETIPHFVKGIPSLGINSTDPLFGDPVHLDLAGGLKIEFNDGVIKGFRKCVVEHVKYEGLEAQLNLRCSLSLKGKYKATGRVLIFAINGEGDARIKTPNVAFSCKITFEDVTRDGVIYREIKDYKASYSYDDKVNFQFTNLFKGNPELSDTVLTFINENWKQVLDEFGKPITDTIVSMVFNIIKKFFHSIPRDELYVS
ncbi:protein takeout-like [Pararge aegeria]|uniref:Jg13385 protein n=1 Tax=Pararge aegeria aegeria TaxID=348720 RepID=A0A8S4RMP2_9NEOP|nr:protein takeout-like [Pararge aegeria]CAH2238702.1 jg13385 [Pararge aegeria aegeria]